MEIVKNLNKLVCNMKNIFFLYYKKITCSGELHFHLRQIIGNCFDLSIVGGKLYLGRHTHTRSYFNIIVEHGNCTIGDTCFFNRNCSITCLNYISIGNGCTFGNNVVIVDHDHNLKNRGKFVLGEVVIGENTWVGANVVILRDSHIGKNCVIGAGAVVKGEIPDNTIYIQKRNIQTKRDLIN